MKTRISLLTLLLLSIFTAKAYYPYSPYVYCTGNPINFVDPDGLKPTKKEAALMADYVYGTKVRLDGGWYPVEDVELNKNDKTGLKSMLFQRKMDNGETEYALAFAGTELDDIRDIANDVLQLSGLSPQYASAIELGQIFATKYTNSEKTFVGHSLGGGLSAACAYSTGIQAVTFNAAGVSMLTQFPNYHAQIDAYVTINDPLNIAQNRFDWLPNVDGNVIYCLPSSFYAWNGHGISNFYEPNVCQKIYYGCVKVYNAAVVIVNAVEIVNMMIK